MFCVGFCVCLQSSSTQIQLQFHFPLSLQPCDQIDGLNVAHFNIQMDFIMNFSPSSEFAFFFSWIEQLTNVNRISFGFFFLHFYLRRSFPFRFLSNQYKTIFCSSFFFWFFVVFVLILWNFSYFLVQFLLSTAFTWNCGIHCFCE